MLPFTTLQERVAVAIDLDLHRSRIGENPVQYDKENVSKERLSWKSLEYNSSPIIGNGSPPNSSKYKYRH